MKKLLFLASLLISLNSLAYTPSPNAKISVLTCSPGKEIYKVYGHTALRFQDNNRDLVFNYGLFSFDEPHFIWRYLQGKNYYLLGVESYKRFITRYQRGGESVTQQTLQLSQQEVTDLYSALIENAKPENREYLYNVFYDNCATRVYRIIEDVLDGGVNWENNCQDYTYRELLHQHNHPMPFSQLGIDLVFGTAADNVTSCREQMFLPVYLEKALNQAKKPNGEALIEKTDYLLEGKKIHNNRETIIFNISLSLLLLVSIFIKFKKKKHLRIARIALYSILGLCSLVVWFIAFFSIHPTVLPNLNLLWINPIWLILAAILIIQKRIGLKLQQALNLWCITIAIYLILGLAGAYYIHYGLIYIIPSLFLISFKKRAYR